MTDGRNGNSGFKGEEEEQEREDGTEKEMTILLAREELADG
jgi:hypothetical protein